MTWIKPDDLLGYIEGFQNEGVGNYIFVIRHGILIGYNSK